MQEFKGIMNEEEYAKGVLSRRELLGAAVVAAAGLAAGGLVGCTTAGTDDTGDTGTEVETPPSGGDTSAPPAFDAPPQATPNDSFTQAWLNPSPGLTDADAAETIETDFLIIGGGVAGISAGLSARMENPNLKVTVIEKTDSFTVRGLVFGAVDAAVQTQAGIVYDKDQIFLDWMKYSGNRANPLLVKKWLNESGACYDWFAEVTTEEVAFQPRLEHWPQPEAFNNATEYYRQWNTGIEYTDATGADIWASENGVVSEFYKKSVREGVEYVFNTEAKQLAAAADGSIEGAFADQGGKIVKFVAAKGTMLATGDYGANVEMLQALCPEFYLALRNQPTMIATSTGDGHKMAIWAGAQLEPAPHAHMSHAFAGGFFGLGATAALQLNSFGKRWTNEDVPGQSFTNALLRQPNAISYQIWDDGHVDDMLYHQSIGHGNREMQLVTPESLVAQHESWKEALAPGYEGFMWGGNTLDELFEKLGLPADVAKAEVERYNELCAKGHDDDFFKRADRMYPVSEGPFYASMAFIAAGVMTAGVMVDGDLQIINADGVPLGKLWAAGNVAGGRYSIDYPTNCPATSHGTAITFGRSIGKQVATL
jgi:succinate dehydrogenase/fumarate reductase flavoprotein subunit